jgi:hypothetical protein
MTAAFSAPLMQTHLPASIAVAAPALSKIGQETSQVVSSSSVFQLRDDLHRFRVK